MNIIYKRKMRLLFITITLVLFAFRSSRPWGADSLGTTVDVIPDTAIVYKQGVWIIRIPVREYLPAGGVITIEVPRFWQTPQVVDSNASAFVSAWTFFGSSKFSARVDRSNLDGFPGSSRSVVFSTVGAPIAPGDTLFIRLGQDRHDSLGIRPNAIAGKQYFRIRISGGGHIMSDSAALTVLPKSAQTLLVCAPSVVEMDEWKTIRVSAIDVHGNLDWRFRGSFAVSCSDPAGEIPNRLIMSETDSGRAAIPVKFRTGGIHSVKLVASGGRVFTSNPIRCEETPQYRIYWGDPHAHSIISNHGYGTPAEVFWYARNVSLLDWISYSEHDYISPQDFRTYEAEASNYANEAGRFVTIVGTEYTGDPQWLGHINIFFPQDNPSQITYRRFSSIYSLMDALRRDGAIAQINHPFRAVVSFNRWEEIDTSVVRSVEVINERQEFDLGAAASIEKKLRDGYAFGFSGSSDNHMPHPGMHWTTNLRPGTTAVIAASLTRSDIFEGLKSRRTYASNGIRPIIDFRVNDQLMGSVLNRFEGDSDSLTIFVRVCAEGRIDSLQIIKGGETFLVHRPISDTVTLTLTDVMRQKESFYYLVLYQQGGGKAWTSPIFLKTKRALAAPRTINPRGGQTVAAINNRILFSWSSLLSDGLAPYGYSLSVFGPSLDTVTSITPDSSMELDIVNKLNTEEIYSWYVSAILGQGTVLRSDTASFSLKRFAVGASNVATVVPNAFELYQPYPNPFNSMIQIRYAVAEQSEVKLIVYDIVGRTVATLVNKIEEPGFYTVSWRASNVPSGVYFCQMQASQAGGGGVMFTAVRKLVLVK